jgi:hypothetical protein
MATLDIYHVYLFGARGERLQVMRIWSGEQRRYCMACIEPCPFAGERDLSCFSHVMVCIASGQELRRAGAAARAGTCKARVRQQTLYACWACCSVDHVRFVSIVNWKRAPVVYFSDVSTVLFAGQISDGWSESCSFR